MKTDILISFVSWEDRYIMSLSKDLETYTPTIVILFKYDNILTTEWKTENIEKSCKSQPKPEVIILNPNNPKEKWEKILSVFSFINEKQNIVINVTTMPREIIWDILFNCKKSKANCLIIYYKPEKYSNDWISRDPDYPRLLYKMSGIATLNRPTILIVTCGFDILRLDNLISSFEPKSLIIFIQEGNDPRNKTVINECTNAYGRKYGKENIIRYNAYNVENTYELISKLIDERKLLDHYNIILGSLGAKISAIALFKIWLKYPQVALSYIRSKEYNRNYSSGIGEKYIHEIDFRS